MVFFFSGTGNSRWAAEEIAKKLSDHRIVNMGEALLHGALQYQIESDERVGFVFPVHAWDVPELVARFISELQFEGGVVPSYLYLLVTCGDDTGRTLEQFVKLVSGRGWTLHAACAVRLPNTYVCLPGFDVDKIRVAYHKLRSARDEMKNFGEKVQFKQVDRIFQNMIPGAFANFKTYMLGPLFRRFLLTDKPFHVDEVRCTGCRRCVKTCIVGNISFERNHPAWHGKCTSCLACYHSCPQHAVQYGRFTQNKGQYVFSQTLLKEAMNMGCEEDTKD